ncbi:hypothetical protein FBU31_000083 [Coemansia sp. 'formosensis']|nr:hypothetical protein FBU31_000083 [Coemansia sp. 'formosensis']
MFISSPFQFLPIHIVRLIVGHVVGSSRQALAGIEPNSSKWNTLLKPLLWICQNFRTVAYPLYCSRFKLTIANSQTYHRLIENPETSLLSIGYRMSNGLGYPTHHLAKTLDIEIDEESIYSGEALNMLSLAPYDSCAFPLVRRIIFLIALEDGFREGTEIANNAAAFVQRIKQMAPNVDDIWVRPLDHDGPRYNSSYIYDSLVSQLFQLAVRVQYSEIRVPLVPVNLDLVGISNLVHIQCTVGQNGKSVIMLAHQNSTTLESLTIDTGHILDVPSIIRDEHGDFVTYPHLHTLKLNGYSSYDEDMYPVFTGAVPFPSLRCLKLKCEYTFGDDVFFKGNAATLVSLDLYLSSSTITMLRKLRVFTPTSHPELRHVKLWGMDECVPDIFATDVEALNFAMGIGPTAPMRDINGHQYGSELILMLPQLDGLGSIRYLSLNDIALNLWDAITLIKALPMMTDLSAMFSTVGPLPDGVTLDELPAYIVSTYAPMCRQFRCWHISDPGMSAFTVEARCVLLLALACPNFTFAALAYGNREMFEKQLENEIASDMFKPYAPRMQCFVSQ